MNKILVLAGWNSALSVNKNSWIGGYQIFFITVSTTLLLQNFGKHSWKHCLSVKFRLAAYAFIGYDFIELMIFLYRLNIYPEVFYTYTLNSMTQLDDDLLFRKVIFLSQNWHRVSIFINQTYALKTKTFIPISSDDSLFLSLLFV